MAQTDPLQHSVIPALWIPVAVFTHVFAALWLLRAFQLMQPAEWAKIRKILRLRRKIPGSGTVPSSEASTWPVLATGPGVQPNVDVGSSCSSSLQEWGATSSSTDSSSNQYPPVTYPSSSSSTAGSEVGSVDGDAHAVAVLPAGDIHAAGAAKASVPHAGKQLHPPHQHSCQPHKQQQQQPGLRLTWRSIGCVYKTAAGPKPVLHDVWGEAAAGEIQVRGRAQKGAQLAHCCSTLLAQPPALECAVSGGSQCAII